MENTFNASLRRIRKEKGITQEQLAEAVGVTAQAVSKWETNSYPDAQLLPAVAKRLGVTIDELFGKASDNADIYEKVFRHINDTPYNERFKEIIKICRAFPVAMGESAAYVPITQNMLDEKSDHYCQVIFENGFLQMRCNSSLQYFIVMPEPECGYDEVLAYDKDMVELYKTLAIPNALRAIYFLAGREGSMFFRSESLMCELNISKENAEQIINGFLKIGIIWEANLTVGENTEKIYQYISKCDFISFLNSSRTIIHRPQSFSYYLDNGTRKRYFKNDTYKKKD